MPERITATSCPNCGAPLKKESSSCTYCDSELNRIPNFGDSDTGHEKDLKRTLLEEKDEKNFFFLLDFEIKRVIGGRITSSELTDPKRGVKLLYELRVGKWLLSNKDQIINNRRPDAYQQNPIDKIKEKIKNDRQVFQAFLDGGWPGYMLGKLEMFNIEHRNEVFEALDGFENSANKTVTGEIAEGKMSAADKLVQVLFCTDAVHDVKRIMEHNKQEAANFAKEKEERKRWHLGRNLRRVLRGSQKT